MLSTYLKYSGLFNFLFLILNVFTLYYEVGTIVAPISQWRKFREVRSRSWHVRRPRLKPRQCSSRAQTLSRRGATPPPPLRLHLGGPWKTKVPPEMSYWHGKKKLKTFISKKKKKKPNVERDEAFNLEEDWVILQVNEKALSQLHICLCLPATRTHPHSFTNVIGQHIRAV